MTRNEIIEKLKEIFQLVINNGISLDDISESADVTNDLGVNSIGLIYMAVAIEKTFNIDMSNVSINTFKTIKDVVDYIENGLK